MHLLFFTGGERGIRTLGTREGTLPFQGSQINHSCTSPCIFQKQIYHLVILIKNFRYFNYYLLRKEIFGNRDDKKPQKNFRRIR